MEDLIKKLEGERDAFEQRCKTNTEMWIDFGHKLGLNPPEGPVNIDGIMLYCLTIHKSFFDSLEAD